MLRLRLGRVWLGIIQVVLLLVMIIAPATAATTPPPLTDLQLIELLRSYSIVRGDNLGNLNLDQPITRAEMVTIAVRAMGGEEDARLFSSISPFSDAKGHWAQNNITYAYIKKLIQGDGNGTVRPNAPISYAEALTLILRMVGREPSGSNWPTNVILSAAELGLMPPGVTLETVHQSASRGLIFRSLAIAVTTIKTPDSKTFLQAYVDKTPPSLNLEGITSPTKDTKVAVKGQALDAVAVQVNGQAVTLTGNQFATEVDLVIGTNTISVEAVDRAGNITTQSVSVVRVSPLASLEVAGPATLKAGATGTYTVTGLDSTGKAVPSIAWTAKVSGNIGTFDAAKGVFTAGNVTASGSITFTAGPVSKKVDVQVLGPSAKTAGIRISPINGGHSVPISRPMTVEVRAVDINGELVKEDNGREVTLETSGVGTTVLQPTAKTQDGIATFTLVGTMPSQFTVTAKSADISPSIVIASFGTSTRVLLRTDSDSLYTAGTPLSTRVTAELRDENGSLVTNTSGSDIIITLNQSGAVGDLPDSMLTIRRGLSTSTASFDDGVFSARNVPGQVLLSGNITSGHQYSVDPKTIWISAPTAGAGAKLQILNVNPAMTPGGPAASVMVRVVDAAGTVITNGSYAFRIKVDTTNNETKTNGLPEGVSLTLGGTSFSPVDTGFAPSGTYVYGRTVNGTATLLLSYNKSGVVTLTPTFIGTTATAYSSDGIVAAADGAGSLAPVAEKVLFSGAVTSLRLTVDSALGNNQTSGAVAATSGAYFTLRATVLDQFGGRIPGSTAAVTLVPANSGNAAPDNTTPPTFPNDTKNAVDGVAEFLVYSRTAIGCDSYKVTTLNGNVQSQGVELCVRNGTPADPRLITARGSSGLNNRVRMSDVGMEIELAWATTGTDTWVSAVVYQDGAEIYASDVFDMSSPAPRVVVPRRYLAGGQHTYSVALKNAAGISNRSGTSNPVTVDYESGSFGFSGARYDASTNGGHKLTVFAYGLSTTNAEIDPAKLTLKDASTGQTLNLQGTAWTISNNSQFVIDLAAAPAKLALVESPVFSGKDVTLEGDAGWYYQLNGASAVAMAARRVTPMATIENVTFDVVNNRLTISGNGFETGNIDISKLKITQGTNALVLSGANVQSWGRSSDSSITVNLTDTGARALKNSTLFNGSDVIQAEEGWLADGTAMNRPIPSGQQTSIPVSAQVTVNSINYVKRQGNTPAQLVILGSGFFSGGSLSTAGTVDLDLLSIKDLSLNQAEPLSGSGASASLVSDGEIRITIADADATIYESTFSGSDIYVIGQPAWFKDFQNRRAGAIQERYFRLTIN